MSDEEDRIDVDSIGGDDLFGDDVDATALGSPDGGRIDRDEARGSDLDDDDDDDNGREVIHRQKRVMALDLYRHDIPRPTDGTLQSLRIPKFVKIMPEEYRADDEPTDFELDNSKSANPMHLVRWRTNPTTGKMESNANIYRWNDGSITLSIGDEQFEIQQKVLAPRPDQPYNINRDTHYYAASANMEIEALLTIGHIHEQLDVRPNDKVEDEAIQQLRAKMDAQRAAADSEDTIITTNVDPELQKKEAELAEKERNRAQRRRENAAARLDGIGGRGRGGGGLTIGDLESTRRPGASGGRKKGGAGGTKGKRRRNDTYDSDDDLSGGAGRQNDYDEEDDFIAPSDEEGAESGAEESEEEEEAEEEEEDERPRAKRQRTAEGEDADADADADGDVTAPSGGGGGDHGRRAKRQIIDDDDEDVE